MEKGLFIFAVANVFTFLKKILGENQISKEFLIFKLDLFS